MILACNRRQFVAALGAAGVAGPTAARAQQPGKGPRIGFLGTTSALTSGARVEAFRTGLRDLGYVEGTNIEVVYRFAEDHYERLPELAADLVRANVQVIVTHSTPGGLAVKQATATIPIVMASVGDPVAAGIVSNLARPGGNITGQSFFNPELRAKRIELLKELRPDLRDVAVLLNPDNPATMPEFKAMETTAARLGVRLHPVRLKPAELVEAFEQMERQHIKAVETGDDPLFSARSEAVAALASRGRLLSIGPKEFAEAGGLIGYGTDVFAMFRHTAVFVDKILKGAKPADLPFEQATKFETVLNMRTAKALGLEIPTATLLRADQIIE